MVIVAPPATTGAEEDSEDTEDAESMSEGSDDDREEDSDAQDADQISLAAGTDFQSELDDKLDDLIIRRPAPTAPLVQQASIWEEVEQEYATEAATGPPIGIESVVGKAQLMFSKSMHPEFMKLKLENTKVPENCPFMLTKRINPEIWALASTEAHNIDIKAQKVTTRIARVQSRVLQATEDLIKLANKVDEKGYRQTPSEEEYLVVLNHLREATALGGSGFISINNLRRLNVKPFVNPKMKEIIEEVQEEKVEEWLFGDNLDKRIVQIRDKAKTDQELIKKNLALAKSPPKSGDKRPFFAAPAPPKKSQSTSDHQASSSKKKKQQSRKQKQKSKKHPNEKSSSKFSN